MTNQQFDANDTEWVIGFHAVQSILKTSPERAIELWLLNNRRDQRLQKTATMAERNDVITVRVSAEQMEEHVQSDRHQGVALRVEAGQSYDEPWLIKHLQQLSKPALILVLDKVTDPHNLGACLRTADATAVDAVIVPRDNASGITPIVRKVASGAAETVPLVMVTNLVRCMKALQQEGVWFTGLSDQADTGFYDQDYRGSTGLVLGAEGEGMRRLTSEHCDYLVSIPMQGSVSSLNVSVAAGVCLYEVARQRLL